MRLPHQMSHLSSAWTKRHDVAGIIAETGLRYSQAHCSCFRGSIIRLVTAQVHKSGRVGFACLGGTGAYTTLEASVVCHCQAFHVRTEFPSNRAQTIGPRQRPETEVPLPPFKTVLGKISGGSAVGHANLRMRKSL